MSGERSVPYGPIYEDDLFHAHQDVAYPVPGQVILASKRHFRGLTEMSPDEVDRFMPLVQRPRAEQAR